MDAVVHLGGQVDALVFEVGGLQALGLAGCHKCDQVGNGAPAGQVAQAAFRIAHQLTEPADQFIFNLDGARPPVKYACILIGQGGQIIAQHSGVETSARYITQVATGRRVQAQLQHILLQLPEDLSDGSGAVCIFQFSLHGGYLPVGFALIQGT